MNEKKHRFTLPETYGVWEAHRGVCFWCEEPLPFKHVTIDHVLPESLEGDPTELAKILALYALPPSFQVNDFSNWVPAHSKCNARKGTSVYTASPAMIDVLDRVAKRADRARRQAAQIERTPDHAKAIASVEIWIDKELLTKADVDALALRRGWVTCLPEIGAGCGAVDGGADVGTLGGRPDDPYATEIDAYRRLSERFLFAEALEGLKGLEARFGNRDGIGRSRLRVANNSGVCLMGLGRFAEARDEFRRAIEIDGGDDLPHVNLAAAYFMDGQPEHALAVLERPITLAEMRGKACALRVGALHRLGRRSEIELILSETWTAHDPHVQLAAAQALHAAGELTLGNARLDEALQEPTTAAEANILAGTVALCVSGDVGDGRIVRIGSDVPAADLAHALGCFRRALELTGPHLRDLRSEVHGTCGMILVLLGETSGALEEFARARAAWSRPRMTVVANHAALLIREGQFGEAARIIRESELAEQHPHLRLQLGAALLGGGAHAEAVDVLHPSWSTLQTEEHRIHGAAMILDAARHLGRTALLEEVTGRLELECASNWDAWVHLGRHFAAMGARDRAAAAFATALGLAGVDDAPQVREELAYRQATWGDARGCIATLAPLSASTLGEAAAQALVVSLYNIDDFKNARSMADTFLARGQAPRRIVEVAVAVASLAGDLGHAIELQERILREHPPRLKDVTSLATLHLRNGERARAASVLATAMGAASSAEDAHELMVFAHLLSDAGDVRALEFGYRSWARAGDQPQVQLGFVGLFLRREREGRDGVVREVVEAGTTVELSSPGRGPPRKVSVLHGGELVPDAGSWVREGDPLARALLGKRVGDPVAGASSPMGQITYRIEKIYSNYVRVFQETINGFNERFPDAEGLWKVEVPKDDPMEFTRVLLATQGDTAKVRKLVALHSDGHLPVAALASALHRSVPVIWSALANDEVAHLRFSDGADREAGVADQIVVGSALPIYLDYTALMTLFHLGDDLRAKICRIIGPLRVLQSLLDDLRQCALRARPMGAGKGLNVSVADDGRLRVSDIGDEQGFLEGVERVAREVATASPAYAIFDEPATSRDLAVNALGPPTADLLVEAASAGGRLLCDDALLAAMARSERHIEVASVQGVALSAHRKGLLSLEDYAAVVERLAVARYSFVTVNADVLGAVLKRHGWQPTAEVDAVFASLKGACTPGSAAVVGSYVVKAIMLEPAAALRRDALLDLLLAPLTAGHDASNIVAMMNKHLERLLHLVPLHFQAVQLSLQAWLAARG